ncbi:MAG: alanine racemase [Rickettsiales bacterium]|nr:alanine racemase [Rickettsiales bacterium]
MNKKLPLAYVELSSKNLVHNIRIFKRFSNKTRIIAVIKGNAYGHGQNEIAKILDPHVDFFQVNSFLELKLLRKISKKKVFVLGYVSFVDLEEAIKLNCILAIFSLKNLEEIDKLAKSLNVKQEIHIPVDAFLGREGFSKDELIEIFKNIKYLKNIKLTGMYAHFANIEDTDNFLHAKKQIDIYSEMLELAKLYDFSNLQTHISATSGFFVYEFNKNINSFIRLGIGLYGLWPSEHIKYQYLPTGKQGKNKIELKPVLSLKTKVAQIKILPKGYPIGYGLTYITKITTKVAIIPMGYADGIDRGLSNNGEVLILGSRCKILGRVAMNMFVVDVTHLNNIEVEDEVVIIGKQGDIEITVEEIAKKIDSINYEVITRLNPLLPKIVI